MVYRIKKEKVEELKDGRTNKAIASRIGLTTDHLGKIFNGRQTCTQALAMLLTLLGKNLQIEEGKLQETVEYFFEQVDK